MCLLRRSLDSPKSSSLELVTHRSYYPGGRERDSETPENHVRHSENTDSSYRIPGWEGDSDIEVEQDPPDWTSDVPEDVLSRLDRVGKKRQEVLNGIYTYSTLTFLPNFFSTSFSIIYRQTSPLQLFILKL